MAHKDRVAIRNTLRAVAPDEVPPPRRDFTVTEAAKEGTARDLLAAMRDRIAKAVEDEHTSPRDLAALTKRLGEMVREIEAIDARESEVAESVAIEDGRFDVSAI